MNDSEIVRGLSLPDQRDVAMRQLTEQFGVRLYQRIKSIVNIDADAQDVYQNALIKVLRGIKSYKADSSLYSWLYRIASNEALDFLRKRKRTASTPQASMERGRSGDNAASNDYRTTLQNQAANARGYDAAEIEKVLSDAIEKLPPQQRSVFEARYFAETPYAILAETSGKSEGALKANYHHAVQKVTAFIKEHAPISTP